MFLTSEKNQIDMESWLEEWGGVGSKNGRSWLEERGGSKIGGVDLMNGEKDKVEKV